MHEAFSEFMGFLETNNKEKCIEFILEKLSRDILDIKTLYTEILEPALNNIGCNLNEENLCIWREHVRSSIVRTIIECCYPFVMKEKRKKYENALFGSVVVVCPDGEYHDIGARMTSDFFSLCGFDSVFVGSSTPKDEFISAIGDLVPDYIAISVTNYYNLVAAKKTVENIKNSFSGKVKILVGGHAFYNNAEAFKKLGADLLIKDFKDIENLKRLEV